MTFLSVLRSTDVVDARSFAEYAQQILGTPIPESPKDLHILNTKTDEFFVQYPSADWRVLAATVDWCRAKRKRPANAWWIVTEVRYAWNDGAIPDLDPRDPVEKSVEYNIELALEKETDPYWQRMLLGSVGAENRREVLAAWRRK